MAKNKTVILPKLLDEIAPIQFPHPQFPLSSGKCRESQSASSNSSARSNISISCDLIYKLRCESMLLKEEFGTNMAYLEPAVESIVSAAQELKQCPEMHEVLYMLLVAGNFLNSGGYAGEAAGFKIMSLLKITDTRANKPGVNFIHYVAQEVEKKFPNLLIFYEQLPSLEDASKLSIDNLKSEISNLSQKVLKTSQQVSTAGGDIKRQMEDFLKLAAAETTALQKEIEELDRVRIEMAEFLCEDLQSFKLEECFKIFQAFCVKFKSAVEENVYRRQQERRAEARRRQREDQLNLKRKNQAENRPSSYSGSESDNVIDMLLYEINGGVSKNPFNDPNFNKSQRKGHQTRSRNSPAELSRMNSLTSSLPSEEEISTCSPRVIRRRIGSLNSVATNCESGDFESPDVTPNGTLRRKRNRLSSDDHEDNSPMDYLRQSAENDSPPKLGNDKLGKTLGSDAGSLDRSILRRSSRRRRTDILASELNERERPASPLASPIIKRKADLPDKETNKPKPWRKKIEDWLSESEKEQQREKEHKEKITFGKLKRQEKESDDSSSILTSEEHKSSNKNLETLHEAKTDSELYSEKLKAPPSEFPKTMGTSDGAQLKDKSKWRKSTLNVANSSESIDDERRRNRSRKSLVDLDSSNEDTITLYLRGPNDGNKGNAEHTPFLEETDSNVKSIKEVKENLIDDKIYENPRKRNTSPTQQHNDVNTTTKPIADNVPVKKEFGLDVNSSVADPKQYTHIKRNRLYQSMKETSPKTMEKPIKSTTKSDDESLDDNSTKTCGINNSEKSAKYEKPDAEEDGNFDRFSFMRKTRRRTKPKQKSQESEKPLQDREQEPNSVLDEIEGAIKDIDKASQEIRNLQESNNLTRSGLSYKSQDMSMPENTMKKTKPTLKTRLSNRFLSLTENLKGKRAEISENPDSANLTKYKEFSNHVPLCTETQNEYSEKMNDSIYKAESASEKQNRVNNEALPIMQHREKVLYGPRQSSSDRSLYSSHNFQPLIDKSTSIKSKPELKINGELGKNSYYGKETETDKNVESKDRQSKELEVASQEIGANDNINSMNSSKILYQREESQQRDFPNSEPTANSIPQTRTNSVLKDNSTHKMGIKPYHSESEINKQDKELHLSKPTTSTCSSGVQRTNSSSTKKEDKGLRINEKSPIQTTSNIDKTKNRSKGISSVGRRNLYNQSTTLPNPKMHSKSPLISRKESPKLSTHNSNTTRQNSSKRKDGLKSNQNSAILNEPIGQRVAAYTKAIRSMTNSLRRSNRGIENYDVTQSMPPTPSEENKSLVSSLTPNGSLHKSKRAKSSSAVNVLKSKLHESLSSTPIGSRSGSRRSSEKSLDRLSRRSSDRSLNLSRKSSDTSIATVKCVSKSNDIASTPSNARKLRTLISPISKVHAKTSPRIIPSSSDNHGTNQKMKTINFRNQKVNRQISNEKIYPETVTSASKPRLVVRRSSSDGSSCSFMKATSSSSAKVTPQSKMGEQRHRTRPSLLANTSNKSDNLSNRVKDR